MQGKRHWSLKELASTLSTYADSGYGDNVVVIRTHDPQIVTTLYATISGVYPGFDWDDGKIFIEPTVQLTAKPDRYQSVHETEMVDSYGGRPFLGCKNCREKVSKSDNFCKRCGLRLRL